MKYKYISIILLTFLLGVTSCDEDTSTSYTKEFSTVEIKGEKDDFNVVIGERVVYSVDSVDEITPDGEKITINPDSDRFEFEWWKGYQINGGALIDKINDGYELDWVVDDLNSPNLVFLVREKATQLEYYFNISVNVGTTIGSGFFIADTRDELTTQFHEIQNSYLFRTAKDEIKVERNNFQKNQGGKFQGLVKSLIYQKNPYGGGSLALDVLLLYTTDGNAYALDGNFSTVAQNDAIYLTENKGTYRVKAQEQGFDLTTNLTDEGQIQVTQFSDYNFTTPYITGDFSPYKASVMRSQIDYSQMRCYIYDELNNRFLMSQKKSSVFVPVSNDNSGLIDFNDTGKFDALYMTSSTDRAGKDPGVLTVMKSEVSNEYYVYKFISNGGKQKIINLNGCLDIDKAVAFTAGSKENILYYAVNNKVYAVGLSVSNPTAYLAYTAPEAGDKITNIENWRGVWWSPSIMQTTDINNPGGDPIEVENTGRMVNVTTYNEATKEGKFICVPITTLNSPNNGLEKNTAYHRVFDGFGRIIDTSREFRSRDY